MRLTLILLTLLFWTDTALDQPGRLVLNTSYSSPITSPDKTGFLDLLYAELFQRLSIPFEIQALPAERALQNANEGIDDGDVCRVADLVNQYSNMVRGNEPVMQYQHVVFSKEKDFAVNGPDSLAPYSLGIVTGWKIVERTTAKVPSRILVDDARQLFQMLDQKRIEIAVIERMVGLEAAKAVGVQGIRVLSPPLLSGDWFLYLHKRHLDLIPRIDAELARMKQDGTHERIRRQVLGRYETTAAP